MQIQVNSGPRSEYMARFKRANSVLLSRLSNEFSKLSGRERLIVLLALGVVLSFLGSSGYSKVTDIFGEQARLLEEAENQAQSVPGLLSNYAKLTQRREEIKNRYKQFERREGTLSYLEKLIQNKSSETPLIVEGQPQQFGVQFEQVKFTITRIRVNSMENLADLLSELVSGKQPFLITRLQIDRPYSGNRVDVELDVVSIAEANNSTPSGEQALPTS